MFVIYRKQFENSIRALSVGLLAILINSNKAFSEECSVYSKSTSSIYQNSCLESIAKSSNVSELADFHAALGYFYSRTLDLPLSVNYFQKSLYYKIDAEILTALGSVLYNQSKFDEAGLALNQAYKMKPQSARVNFNLAIYMKEKEDNLSKALFHFREALEIDPSSLQYFVYFIRNSCDQQLYGESKWAFTKYFGNNIKKKVNAQILLRERGLYFGEIDGDWGVQTNRAIDKWVLNGCKF